MLDLKKRQYRRIRKAMSQKNEQSKQREQTDLMKLLDSMINHCKQLANCVLDYKRLSRDNIDNQLKVDRMFSIDQKCYNFYSCEGPITSTFNSYTKLFFFRLIKQMKYFSQSISIIEAISKEMNDMMVSQCTSNMFSIEELFHHCEKKLLMEARKIRRAIQITLNDGQEQLVLKNKCSKSQPKKPLDVKSQMMMLLIEKVYNKEKNREKQKSKQAQGQGSVQGQKQKRKIIKVKKDMEFFQVMSYIKKTIYKILPLERIQAAVYYLPNLSPQLNIDQIARRQMKRNNKTRKQINQYQKGYEHFKDQKMRRTGFSTRLRRNHTATQQNDNPTKEFSISSNKLFKKQKQQQNTSFLTKFDENSEPNLKNYSKFRIKKTVSFEQNNKSLKSKSKSNFSKTEQIPQNQSKALKQMGKPKNSSILTLNKNQKKLRILPR